MPTPDDPDKAGDALDRVGREIAAAQAKTRPAPSAPSGGSGMAVGYRMSAEFVAAIAVGGVFGFGGDWLFGTSPLGLILGIGFGFAAGVLTLLRSARAYQASLEGRDGQKD